MENTMSVEQLLGYLISQVRGMGTEHVLLGQSVGRVIASDQTSGVNVPETEESLRDGYAVHRRFNIDSGEVTRFTSVGELAAGEVKKITVSEQQVCRVMTGAAIPANCTMVVPQELCQVEGSSVHIPKAALLGKKSHIQEIGCEVAKGQTLVNSGKVLSIKDILQCASVGIQSVEAYKQPKVGFFCSGGELVTPGENRETAKKYSTNQLLLTHLIRRFGGEPLYLGMIGDTLPALTDALANAVHQSCDLLLTTGGTGPGKYDLLAEAFKEAGGQLVSTTLALQPGKSLLTGQLENTIFYGLPGPPAAVETLFYEVVGPMLTTLAGVKSYTPLRIEAYLGEDIETRPYQVTRLKGGVLRFKKGRGSVVLAGKKETANCNIRLQPGKSRYKNGELVVVHCKSSPFDETIFDSLDNKNLLAPQL